MKKEEIYEKIIKILSKYNVKIISIFGSFSKDEETRESDIDILVEFNEVKSLYDLVGIEMEIKEEIGLKVDLVTKDSVSPYLIDTIMNEAKLIYG